MADTQVYDWAGFSIRQEANDPVVFLTCSDCLPQWDGLARLVDNPEPTHEQLEREARRIMRMHIDHFHADERRSAKRS